MFLNQEFATQLFGDFRMVNIASYCLVGSVNYVKVESRKVTLILNSIFWI